MPNTTAGGRNSSAGSNSSQHNIAPGPTANRQLPLALANATCAQVRSPLVSAGKASGACVIKLAL
jgi:hypothetical protein